MQTVDETRTDIELLQRIVTSDEAALADLYDRHSHLLFGLILRILKDQAEAEDILQEVFVQAWTRAGTYNAALGTPVGWLVGIARNRAIDRLRAKVVRARSVEAVSVPVAAETPEARASLSERQREVQQVIAALPPDQRELIEEAYFRGLTHTELAARFRLPLGTVKTRIRTGLLTLRSRLQHIAVEQ